MANIKDLKETESYINKLKKSVDELISMNDFSLFVYVNDTPIDEFFRNLETLNPEDSISALRDGLSKLNFETTGINVTANGEFTTEYIDKSFVNGISEFTSKFGDVGARFIASIKDTLNTQSAGQSKVSAQSQTSEQVDNLVDSLDDSLTNDLAIDINATDSVDVAPSQQLTKQQENHALELADDFDYSDTLDDFTEEVSDAAESLKDLSDDLSTGIDSLEYPQPVTQDASVQKPSEQVETKFSDETFKELKSSLDELTDKLALIEGIYISEADEKLSITDNGFIANHGYGTELSIAGVRETASASDYEDGEDEEQNDIHRKPSGAISAAIEDISGSDATVYEVINDMKVVSDQLPVFTKALQLAGIELTDIATLNTKEALDKVGVKTTETVNGEQVDRDISKISYEEKQAAIYAKATKELVDAVKADALARSEQTGSRWESNLANNETATAMLSAVENFAKFNDMRPDAPKKPDTTEIDRISSEIVRYSSLKQLAPMQVENIQSDTTLTQSERVQALQEVADALEEAEYKISELNKEYDALLPSVNADKERYKKEMSQFNAKVYQEQKSKELNNTIARGTDTNESASVKINALEEVKTILNEVDKALKKTGAQEINEYQTSKASAQEFLSSYDVNSVAKQVKADKAEIDTILKNSDRFEKAPAGEEPKGYTNESDRVISKLLEKSAKDLELFDNALKNAGESSLANKDYQALKNFRAKLDKEANDDETGKSYEAKQKRFSKAMENFSLAKFNLANKGKVTASETIDSDKPDSKQSDSEWLNKHIRDIQLEYRKASIDGTYASLKKLVEEIDSQVSEREHSDNPLDVKQSELNSYNSVIDKATKYINKTKKANEAAKSEADLAEQRKSLTQLERDINDYKIEPLDGKSNEEQISVFEQAAAATKEFSDKLVDYTDSSFKTQRSSIQKTLNARLKEYQSKIKSLGGDTSKVDSDVKASEANNEEINKRSSLSAITNEVRQSRTGYNGIRETASPEDLYKYIEDAIGNVEAKITEAVKEGNSEEEAKALADVFKRDFSGYQSTQAVAAIKQYVTLDGSSIDQLVDSLGNAEKVQSLPNTVPDYVKNIIAKSDSKSDVGRAVISQQTEIKTDKLAKDIADTQAEVDIAKERVQSFKNNNDTANASKALENLADKQRELSDLYKSKGDTVKTTKALLDSSASTNEAIDIKNDVPLELQQLNKELNEKLKEIDDTIANAEDKLSAQRKAVQLYDKNYQALASNILPTKVTEDSYNRTKATAEKKVANTQTSVAKQDLDKAKAYVGNSKAIYDTVKRTDSGATTQEVQVANQEYIDSLKSLVALQEKYKDTDAVKDSDISNTNSSITQALYEAERIKTGVTREATEQLKLFEQQLKQIQSDKTLATADKAYYTQKVSQQAQDAYENEKSGKNQIDVTPEGQAMPHTNEETLNAYKEFAEQAQKTTSYLHQQSVEEERLAANTVRVKQQEQLISQSSGLSDRAQRTRELADLYRQQARYAKDLADKETLLSKAAKTDADAVKLEQQAYQEMLNNIKAVGNAVVQLGKSVQTSINEIVSLVRAGINITNKYTNTTVNGTRKVFSSTYRVIQLFGSLSNRVRQTAGAFTNFARQTVSGLQRVKSSLANLASKFKTVIDRGNANPLRQSWTELNSAISLAQRAFNGVFNNTLLDKAIKFDSTIASITMLLGDKATDNAQEFAKSLQDAFGVSYSETISDLQEITSLLQSAGLQDVGASSEQIGKTAMDFYAISQYLSALGMAGGSATEVMNKLQSGMKGMTQSVDDLGLSVREADMNKFLKDAKKAGKIKVDVKFSELSEANKEAVRLAAIIKQFQDTKNIGNFKDLMAQPYYQVSLIKSRVEEIGIMIGKIFEGIISKYLPAVMALLDVIQNMLEGLASGLHIDLSGDKAQKSLSDISKAAHTTEDSIDGAKKSAKEFDGTAGFDEIESLNSSASTDDEELNLGSLLDDVGSISGMLEKLAKDSLKQTNKVKSNFQKMINSIVGHRVDITFGFDEALAKKQLKAIWVNIKRWWKAVKGTGLYLSVRIAEDLQVGKMVNDILRIDEALTRMGAVIAEYLDPIIKDFYEKYLSKYFKRASNSVNNFSNGMKQLADVVELIFDRKTSNSGVENAINDLAKTHAKLARIAQDLYVLRDNFSGFFAIFQDNQIPDDLLKLDNLKRQLPILTQVLSIIDALADLVRVLYSDYVKPLFDEIRSNFDIVDFLYGVEMKIRDLTSLLDSMEFQIIVKDNFANLLQVAKTTFENIKSIFSGTLTVGAALVTPTDNSGKVTSQSNGGTSVASMAADSYSKQSTELQGFLKSAAQEASAYVTEYKNEIAGIIDTILDQIEKQLELLVSIIGKVNQYLIQNPKFLERIASMVTSILDYVNKNANTILWLLDTIVGFTFDNFNNLLDSLQIIFDYISANKESVQEVLDMFTDFSGEALASIAKIITSLFDYISQHKEEVQSLMDKVLDFLSWLADHPGVIVSVFKLAVLGKVISVVTNLLSPLGSLFNVLSKIFKLGKGKGVFSDVASGVKGIVGKTKGLFNFGKGATVAADGAETLGIAAKSVPSLETTGLATTTTSTGLATTASTDLATTTGAEALNVVNGGLTLGTQLVASGSIVAGIAGGVKDAVDGVKKFTDESSTLGDKFAVGITSAVMSDESGLTGALKNGAKWGSIGAGIGTFIAPGIGTAIGGAVGAVGGAIAGAIDTESAINKVKEIGSGINGVGVDIKKQFGNSMKESVNTITSDTAKMPDKVGAAVNLTAKVLADLPRSAHKVGKDVVTSLCQNDAIQKAFTSARNSATKSWNEAPKTFGAIGSRIANAFKPMGKAISNIFTDIKHVAKGAFKPLAKKSGIFDGASDLVNKAKSALGIGPEKYTKSASGYGENNAKSLTDSKEFKALTPSEKYKVSPILTDYSMKRITKAQANDKLKKFSSSLYIRKLGGTVPTGQMFIANEPGNPEYIGKVGTHTAVANNSMITEAMEAAIYNGLADAWNQRSSATDNKSSDINVNLSGFGLIDKQTLRRLAQMLAPYFEANTKSFRTV